MKAKEMAVQRRKPEEEEKANVKKLVAETVQ